MVVERGRRVMVVVTAEVTPAEGKLDTYLAIAARIRPEAERVDGFISAERFQSIATPGKYLSLSFFRDDEAAAVWRNTLSHRMAQAQAHEELFADYRIRVAQVIRDYGKHDRDQAPASEETA
jgi:heme-degrading monooxygenase HmoA